MPARPAYGEAGDKVVLLTNYFHLQTDASVPLYRYSLKLTSVGNTVDGRTLPTGKQLKATILDTFKHGDESLPASTSIATDYAGTVVSTSKELVREFGNRTDSSDPRKTYHLQISASNNPFQISLQQLLNYLHQSSLVLNGKELMLQALNIVLAKSPSSQEDVATISDKRFFPTKTAAGKLDGVLEARRGYFASIRGATGRLLVNLNVTHSVFFPEKGLADFIEDYLKVHKNDYIGLDQMFGRNKLRVRVDYPEGKGGKTNIRTVTGLARRTNPTGGNFKTPKSDALGAGADEVTFFVDAKDKDPGVKISITQHFQKSKSRKQYLKKSADITGWNRTLKRPKLCVVKVGNNAKNPIFLPPEVCSILPGQPYSGKLDATRQMIAFAANNPAKNRQYIENDGLEMMGVKNPRNDLVSHSLSLQ
jgi:eukaryotic translation initiation factor 2C